MIDVEEITAAARASVSHLRHLVATIPRRSHDIAVDDVLTLINDFFETFARLRAEEGRIGSSLRLTPMWRAHLAEGDDLHHTLLRELPWWQRSALDYHPREYIDCWRRLSPHVSIFLETCEALYGIVDRLVVHQQSNERAVSA